MLRYLAAAVAALVLLAMALLSEDRPAEARPAPAGAPPTVTVERGPEGRVVTVKHAVRGSVTRAALVYDLEGKERHAAVETDCRGARSGTVEDDGYAAVIEIKGPVPEGASRVRLVVESETGTVDYPIEP